MSQDTRSRKEIEWRARLARFAQADASIVEFCQDEGISAPSFYAWRKRLFARAGAATPSVGAAERRGMPPGPFAAVRVTGASRDGSHITASLRGGIRLDIPVADGDAVRLVIEALVRADAEQAGGRSC
jgi:transposase-like protein